MTEFQQTATKQTATTQTATKKDYSMQSNGMHLGAWATGSTSGSRAGEIRYAYFFPIASFVAALGAVFYIGMFNHIENLIQARERKELDFSSEES